MARRDSVRPEMDLIRTIVRSNKIRRSKTQSVRVRVVIEFSLAMVCTRVQLRCCQEQSIMQDTRGNEGTCAALRIYRIKLSLGLTTVPTGNYTSITAKISFDIVHVIIPMEFP